MMREVIRPNTHDDYTQLLYWLRCFSLLCYDEFLVRINNWYDMLAVCKIYRESQNFNIDCTGIPR